MTTRTVHDADGTEWTLAEALVGTDAERADDTTVPVVATPSGGEQSVRLALAPEWEAMDDDALARAVSDAR